MLKLMIFRKLLLTTPIVASTTLSLHAEELDKPPINWPCEQAYVAEVPAAVVWAGPSITGMAQKWEQDQQVEVLVRQLVSPEYDLEMADRDIALFTKKQQPELKDHKLTLLFSGVLSKLNETRQKALTGIIRYADGQAIRATKLSEELDEMVRLQEEGSAQAEQRLAIMQNEMEIKQRMFDERESFIQHLCTRPRLVEEKLGVLARTITYYLD